MARSTQVSPGRRHNRSGRQLQPEIRIDPDRLVDWASQAIAIPSFTGTEGEMAKFMAQTLQDMGLRVQWQQVEDGSANGGAAAEIGRANVLGIREGCGDGPSLMFNGHVDTSYSGQEPWLAHVRGFQPDPFVHEGRLYGLGISNMKGALACYVEALRALADANVTLKGDLMVAAVCGEIEKTQYGNAQGAQYRGYSAGSRYLVSHGGVADMCILGEPTEGKIVLGHHGSMWARISTHGNFIHTAFSETTRDKNSITRMMELYPQVRAWADAWERNPENALRGTPAIVTISAIEGGFGWRLSRTPHRTDVFLDIRVPPTKPMPAARRDFFAFISSLKGLYPDYGIQGEIYLTAPGADIEEGHELVQAIEAAHEGVFKVAPSHDVVRWYSDASALTPYGIACVNYGTSTGLMDTTLGENLAIEGLIQTAEVYAKTAIRICGSV